MSHLDPAVPRRIAVLYSRLSGYVTACLRTLQERHGVETLVVRWPVASEAPFDARVFEALGAVHTRDQLDDDALQGLLDRFGPEGVFMAGWMDKGYLQAARRLKAKGVPVVAGTDAQWRGTPRQHLARLAAPRMLHPAIDVLWGAGERQRQFAERLGYSGARCWTGYYSADRARFTPAFAQREQHPPASPHFLFVGRYQPVKGLDVLLDAYARYRAAAAERGAAPWGLRCAGTGPLADMLQGREGVEDLGFVQPDRLPTLLAEASAFVLPSNWEPWGVALHEAASAGLPLVASDACGAAVHLLQDRYNGAVFGAGDAAHLARGLGRIAAAGEEARQEMGRRSHALSEQFTPERWADTLALGIAELRRRRG